MRSEPDWTKNQAASPQEQPVSRVKRMTLQLASRLVTGLDGVTQVTALL